MLQYGPTSNSVLIPDVVLRDQLGMMDDTDGCRDSGKYVLSVQLYDDDDDIYSNLFQLGY